MKKILIIGFCLCAFHLYSAEAKVPTLFEYDATSQEKLSAKFSDEMMSQKELKKVDEMVAYIIKDNGSPEADQSRLYAYLYTAQKEAVFLSYNVQNKFMGSLKPITSKVMKLFYPSASEVYVDDYSDSLAAIIFVKFKERFDQEEGQKKVGHQANDKVSYGLEIPSWKPWLLANPKEFKSDPVPAENSPFWKEQLEKAQAMRSRATQQQIQRSRFWAGESGPESGNWFAIVNDYTTKHHVPFMKVLFLRSILAEAQADADIAIYNMKHTYAIARPSGNRAVVKLPPHPSYPSGHAAIGALNAKLLSTYFPEDKDYWDHLGAEAGLSRLWGGVHYPIDYHAGKKLGNELGEAILKLPQSKF